MLDVRFKASGFADAYKRLNLLKKAKARSIWRKAVRAGSSLLLKRMKPIVARETKTLQKSLAVRIKARRKDGMIMGIIGPRQKFEKYVAGVKKKPSKYAHLVEKGRKAFTQTWFPRSKSGIQYQRTRHIGAVRPRSFIERALRTAKADMINAMNKKINDELEKLNAV